MKTRFLTFAAALFVALLTLASCGKNSGAYKTLKQDYDSVVAVNTVYQTQMDEFDAIIGRVIDNFQEINAMEGMISPNPLNGEVNMSRSERIEDNIRMINERLRNNRQELASLNEKLKASGAKNAVLTRTIASLEKQLKDKTQEILQLTEELKNKNLQIGILDSMVTELSGSIEAQKEVTRKQGEELSRQEAAANTVRYCVGTMNDLKEMKIVKNGKVEASDYVSDYYRQVDRRSFTSLPLLSKKAELLTPHPANSYRLVEGADKNLTLAISDPTAFWSLSKTLVVRVY